MKEIVWKSAGTTWGELLVPSPTGKLYVHDRMDVSEDGKIERVTYEGIGEPEVLYFLPETRNAVRFDTLEAVIQAAYGHGIAAE